MVSDNNLIRGDWQVNVDDHIPAIKFPMSAVEYLTVRNRICKEYYKNSEYDIGPSCTGCPIEDFCEGANEDINAEVATVEKWAKEHNNE